MSSNRHPSDESQNNWITVKFYCCSYICIILIFDVHHLKEYVVQRKIVTRILNCPQMVKNGKMFSKSGQKIILRSKIIWFNTKDWSRRNISPS